jgi:hypothetical protein
MGRFDARHHTPDVQGRTRLLKTFGNNPRLCLIRVCRGTGADEHGKVCKKRMGICEVAPTRTGKMKNIGLRHGAITVTNRVPPDTKAGSS